MKLTKNATLIDAGSYQEVLGKTFVRAQAETPVLTIGKDVWTRAELAREVGVTNTVAALRLSKYCRFARPASAQAIYDTWSPADLARSGIKTPLPPLGTTAIYVLMAVFKSLGLDPGTWYRPDDTVKMTTYTTVRRHALKRDKPTKTKRRRR